MSAANTIWNSPKTQCFGRNPQFSSDDLPSKYHHWTENLILHITQVFSELTQVYARMSAANTIWNSPKTHCFGRNPQFSSDDLPSKYHHWTENLILHITQVVSESTQVYERM